MQRIMPEQHSTDVLSVKPVGDDKMLPILSWFLATTFSSVAILSSVFTEIILTSYDLFQSI